MIVRRSRLWILWATLLLLASDATAEPSSPVYRFWHPHAHSFFCTINDAEADALILTDGNGWRFQGAAWQAYTKAAPATIAVQQFWNPKLQQFFYTADAQEIAAMQAAGTGWQHQGVAWYSPPVQAFAGETETSQTFEPVFRFLNKRLQSHLYTASPEEVARIFAELPQWQYELAVWSTPSSLSSRILSLTDIHFDPFTEPDLIENLAMMPAEAWDAYLSRRASTALPATGEPTNYALLNAVLANARVRVPTPDFIIYSGDFLGHGIWDKFDAAFANATPAERDDFILKTVTFVTKKIADTFPGVPVVFTLGNVDAFAGDYALVDEGDFLARTAELFLQEWVGDIADAGEFLASYSAHGHYSLLLPSLDRTRLISLSSVFFSPQHPDSGVEVSADAQLDWLEGELVRAQAADERVWLLSHIPPSVDVYATLNSNPPAVVSQWREAPLARFLDLIRAYAPLVLFGQSGHTHMDDFRLISHAETGYFPEESPELIKITPAVSPLFGNNPAYQVYGYDPASAHVIDLDTYYLDLERRTAPAWYTHEYDFATAFDLLPSATGFDELYRSLPTNEAQRDNYLLFYGSSTDDSAMAADWQAYWCGIGALTATEYQHQCAEVLRLGPEPRPGSPQRPARSP
ncbi:hypothetical protein Thiosp_03072 [Thiorhodovibrio litoralis]|nr:hypothetical protein Thiosp_03072 [Thiorhodovibrio litoralis]